MPGKTSFFSEFWKSFDPALGLGDGLAKVLFEETRPIIEQIRDGGARELRDDALGAVTVAVEELITERSVVSAETGRAPCTQPLRTGLFAAWSELYFSGLVEGNWGFNFDVEVVASVFSGDQSCPHAEALAKDAHALFDRFASSEDVLSIDPRYVFYTRYAFLIGAGSMLTRTGQRELSAAARRARANLVQVEWQVASEMYGVAHAGPVAGWIGGDYFSLDDEGSAVSPPEPQSWLARPSSFLADYLHVQAILDGRGGAVLESLRTEFEVMTETGRFMRVIPSESLPLLAHAATVSPPLDQR